MLLQGTDGKGVISGGLYVFRRHYSLLRVWVWILGRASLPNIKGFVCTVLVVSKGGFFLETAVAYHQNLASLLGFGRYTIAVFLKNSSTLRAHCEENRKVVPGIM